MRLMFTLIVLSVAGGTLAGCNTVDGVGKDLETAGRSIQNL